MDQTVNHSLLNKKNAEILVSLRGRRMRLMECYKENKHNMGYVRLVKLTSKWHEIGYINKEKGRKESELQLTNGGRIIADHLAEVMKERRDE